MDNKVISTNKVQPVSQPEKAGEVYITKGVATKIRATSGVSFEIQKKWYKIGYEEERILPENCNVNLEIEALFNHCNEIVDKQGEEIFKLYLTQK